ncbi:hypothetical protein HON36_04790 [Candidatus Parcubacteria bacterium]|nr:hypothetical protein [Candidatus Parcubacteria bacterium]MBT7228858.1 hypothetical protein [Candidatus Parcubacteria bacterium]
MKYVFYIGLIFVLIGCSQSPPLSTNSSEVPKNIEPLSKEVIYQQLSNSQKQGRTIEEASWSISLLLLRNGATQEMVKDINQKIYPKVKLYIQIESPADIATNSYASVIAGIIRENLP